MNAPVIILVGPQMGENIGMVARAMANFGLSALRIVAPRDGWPNDKARAASSGAVPIIDNAQVNATLSEAVADLQFLYATTARPRDLLKPVEGPKQAAARLRQLAGQGVACGILFGRERTGLENDELAIAQAILTFPVDPQFASLNLAQAVLLTAYEWMQAGGEGAARPAPAPPELLPASAADLAGLAAHLESALDDARYFRVAEKRENMALNLRNIFAKANLTEPEVRTLRGAVAALERRWQKPRPAARTQAKPGDA
jgi:tRNA/rRNA methyltransferase